MKLELKRFEYGNNYTIGRLYVDGVYQCFVLEDVVRPVGVKVKEETAIPKGTYKVIIDFSNHFQKNMPHILDVPMFAGIRIHSGNTDKDTEGCLLVGETWVGGDNISGSKIAFGKLYHKMLGSIVSCEDISITIMDN